MREKRFFIFVLGDLDLCLTYSVSQKITPCDLRFSDIFSQTVENFKSVLHTYYTFLSTLDYKFLSSYLKF